jgi:DNA-binding IclR family transcriptional regulator
MYEARSVRKAFELIDLIARQDKRMTLSELSRETGINKSTLHGIARALEEMGVIMRSGNRRYTLGMTLFELARTVHSRIDLREIAHPIIEELMRSTNQTVFLGVRSGTHVSIVDIVESTRDLKITAHIGARIPLSVGATGKAFLAAMAEDEAARFIQTLKLRQDTEKSITDPDLYLQEVRKVRDCGYAVDDEEYIHGVRAIAASIHAKGQPMSAIWVVGFTQSMDDEKIIAIARETKAAAEAISGKFDSLPEDEKKR